MWEDCGLLRGIQLLYLHPKRVRRRPIHEGYHRSIVECSRIGQLTVSGDKSPFQPTRSKKNQLGSLCRKFLQSSQEWWGGTCPQIQLPATNTFHWTLYTDTLHLNCFKDYYWSDSAALPWLHINVPHFEILVSLSSSCWINIITRPCILNPAILLLLKGTHH